MHPHLRRLPPFRNSHSHLLTLENLMTSLRLSQKTIEGDKRIKDSYVEDWLPFRTSTSTMGRYSHSQGGIRMGRILEDIDALAGMISIAHAFRSSVPNMQVVTAGLDRIEMMREFPSDRDVKLSGYVAAVGRSSMEVRIVITEIPDDKTFEDVKGYGNQTGDVILTAKFVMVALDTETLKPISVPKLLLEGEQLEKKRKHTHTRTDGSSLTVEEMTMIHQIYIESQAYAANGDLPPGMIWMKDTEESNLILTHPQDRNVNNKIFGGYLMRLAFELSYADALLTAKCNALTFVSLDDVTFRKPVSIGSILQLHSRVTYSEGYPSKTMQVACIAKVVDPSSGRLETTNEFHFTFEVKGDIKLPKVLPRSYEESVAFIDGKRRHGKTI